MGLLVVCDRGQTYAEREREKASERERERAVQAGRLDGPCLRPVSKHGEQPTHKVHSLLHSLHRL